MIHSGPTVGLAYERGLGMCYVETMPSTTRTGTFRLVPRIAGKTPILRHRSRIQWRTTRPTKKEAA